MLYINSCYRKSYLNTLLEKTGRLWDGVCQDIYMGVITAAINPKILNVEFPLTIAGMSDASVGANANRGVHTNEEFAKLMQRVQKDNNVGGYYRTLYEQYIPSTGTDTYSLYTSIMRAISIGVIPEMYLDQVIPWRLWYQKLASELDIMDVAFDAKIHEMRYCASLLGEDFLAWFDESIYEPLLKPVYIDEKPAYEKDENAICFLGKMSYQPNIDAVLWFAKNVFPDLLATNPDLTFYVLGIEPTPEIKALGRNQHIKVTGFMDNPYQVMARVKATVVPILNGAGIQNKVLEN